MRFRSRSGWSSGLHGLRRAGAPVRAESSGRRSARRGLVALAIGAALVLGPAVGDGDPPVGSPAALAAPVAASCVNRPRIAVAVNYEGGALRATVSPGTSAEVPNNRLQSLRLGVPINGVVDVRGQVGLGANRAVGLPDRPRQVDMLVRRTSGSGSVTIPLTVVDDCGPWTTFVGGGSVAFSGGTGSPPSPPAPTQQPQSPPAPTQTPPSRPSPTGVCGESMSAWHPPVVNGCAAGHEHGDAPPAWIASAGYIATFDGPFNTSARENSDKHAAMKGFLARFNGVDVYFRIHAASNVLDRSARYHSYEVWARDPAGGVSHWQGWYNGGDPVADRVVRTQGDPGRRPIMLVIDQASWDAGIRCEQWYALTAPWSWDFGWTICGINSLFYPGENGQQERQFWRLPLGGPELGGTRRLEAAWYDGSFAGRQHPTGRFWATQFGDIVGGPTDPRCAGTSARFGTTYANVCLEQFIAPTVTRVVFPGNAVQRTFDTTGVQIPN